MPLLFLSLGLRLLGTLCCFCEIALPDPVLGIHGILDRMLWHPTKIYLHIKTVTVKDGPKFHPVLASVHLTALTVLSSSVRVSQQVSNQAQVVRPNDSGETFRESGTHVFADRACAAEGSIPGDFTRGSTVTSYKVCPTKTGFKHCK